MKINRTFIVTLLCLASLCTTHASGQTQQKEPQKTQEEKDDESHKIIEVEEIVVSGNRNEISRRKSASIVGVANRNLFENVSANSAAEVLNFQPGLRMEYNCSNCGVPSLRINGLEGQYTQLLLDSRPVFSSLAGVYGLEQLPESMIERVEVIRGGGSALYGSSAIAGVVNIITREPKKSTFQVSNSTGIYQGGGTDINTSLNGSIVSKDHKAGVYLFSMVRDRSAVDKNGDGFSDSPLLKSTTVGARGFYRFSDYSRLTAEYHHLDEYRRGGNMLDSPAHEADLAEQLTHRINGGGLKYDLFSKDMKHHFNVYISAQNIARDSYFGTAQDLDAYGTTFDATILGGLQYTWNIDKFWFMPAEFTAGFEYNNNYLHDQMLGYERDLAQLSECYGLYAQNEWRNDIFSFLIGGRLDKHNKLENVVFSPRVNVRYVPVEPLTLRASYSSGFRAPQAYDEDLHVGAVGGEISLISLDPDLLPEYSHSVTASVDFVKSFDNLTFNLTAEGFYTKLNDVFVLTQIGHDDSGNLLLERTNASGAVIAGINLEGRLNYLDKVIFNGGFTYQSSEYVEAFEWSEDVEAQRRMFRSPDTYGYLAVEYKPLSALSVSANAVYTGSMLVQHCAGYIDQDEEVETPSFWNLGCKVSYSWQFGMGLGFELSAGVKNILDAYQSDLDCGIDRDAGYIYGPSAPRTYFIGAKFTM